MIGKRTGIDFSQHELTIVDQELLLIHHLKKPDSYYDSIKFINAGGIMAVTGDYSNWLFCREFHPTPGDEIPYEGYWKEKLKMYSCQEPSKYDYERTEEAIKEILNDPDRTLTEEEKDWLNDMLSCCDDEVEYTYRAYREKPSNWDYDNIPFIKSVNHHFLTILDGFQEVCRRLKTPENIIYIK